jgi:probable F420-dependent oxidoreductase
VKIDARLTSEGVYALQTREIAERAERLGIAGLWSGENKHDSFLPLAVAATSTSHIQLGTAVAIAFSRSPMVTAQLAWDLQRRSGGRFLLGLGTQVKAHIERRFSMPWDQPAARLRDYVGALRSIWHSFQTGERLRYEGRFYRHTLLTPVFNPGPIDNPHIPVSVAGVNQALARMAGQVADGFHIHPFHSGAYLRDVVLPAVAEGARSVGRDPSDIELSTSVFVITGEDDRERRRRREDVRSRIAFYASTPSYRVVLDAHGWGDLGERLTAMSKEQRWEEMAQLVSDEMVDAFAIDAEPGDVGRRIRERYEGVVDRVALFDFFEPTQSDEFWEAIVRTASEETSAHGATH